MLLAKIEYLRKRLQSFRKYIEKYDCVTFGCPRTAEDQFDGLLFYHANTDMPYVMILDYLDYKKHPWVEIYVNVNGDNWIKSFQPNTAKCVSNDMGGFIKAIRECKESNHAA